MKACPIARPATIATYAALETALDRLCSRNAQLADARAAIGEARIPLRRRPHGFATLLHLIVYQQISLKAAAAIWQRLAPSADPRSVERLGTAGLKSLGLSAPKARYALGLASAVAEGAVSFERLRVLGDDAAREALTSLPGIGPWSAEIYLLSALLRADAFPAGDLALQEAVRRAFGLKARPSAKELEGMAEAWRPNRAAAARLLWSYYRAAREF